MISQLKTTAVYVSDQDLALRFWTELVGFEVRADHPMGPKGRWIEVAPPGGQTCLVLYPRGLWTGWENHKPSLMFACTDVAQTAAELTARGVTLTQGPTTQPWGTFAKFVDPDGHEYMLTNT